MQPSWRGRAMGTWAALVLGLSVPCFAATAKADTAPAAPANAEQLAAEAYELHAAGKYAEAIATYLKAYEASNAAVTLLNIATIYDRKLHEAALAAEFYRRYLAAPDAEPDLVAKAMARLTAMKAEESAAKPEATSPERAPAEPPPPAPPSPAAAPAPAPPPSAAAPEPPAAAPHRGVRTAGVVVLTTGLAAVGGSLVLGLLAEGKNNDANAVCNGSACSSQKGVDLAHDAGTFATISTVAFVSGLALAAGGLVMIIAGGGSPSPRAAAAVALAPALGPNGGGLSLQGGF